MENENILQENAIKEWYYANCINSNNNAWLTGIITQEFQYSYRTYDGETYYYTMVDVKRKSGTSDLIKVMVPCSLLKVKRNLKGMYMDVKGVMTSYKCTYQKRPIDIYLLAREVRFCTEEEIGYLANINAVCLAGFISKEPYYRRTYMGREITDTVLLIRENCKSNYIPCITWGYMARKFANLIVGDFVRLFGRIQSRKYVKVLEGGEVEERTTYEMSTMIYLSSN